MALVKSWCCVLKRALPEHRKKRCVGSATSLCLPPENPVP